MPVLPTPPVYKLFAVNNSASSATFTRVEVVGSDPAVPTNSFNNLAAMTVAAFAAFCGKSSEDSFRQHHVN
jgi:hypothetical protein